MILGVIRQIAGRSSESSPLHRSVGNPKDFREDLFLRTLWQLTSSETEQEETVGPINSTTSFTLNDVALCNRPLSEKMEISRSVFEGDSEDDDSDSETIIILDRDILRGRLREVLNQKDMFGLSPIHWAVLSNNVPAVKMLLGFSETNPNLLTGRDEDEMGFQNTDDNIVKIKLTPLMIGAAEGNEEMVRCLLTSRKVRRAVNIAVDLHSTRQNHTAFMVAISCAHFAIAKIIVASEKFVGRLWNPRSGAQIFKLLATSLHVENINFIQNDVLLSELQNQRDEIADMLFDKGAKIYEVDDNGMYKKNCETVLHLCVTYNEPRFLEFILKLCHKGVDFGISGRSPLHICCSQTFHHKPQQARLKCAQILVNNAAEIEAKITNTNYTPLLTALHASKISPHAENMAIFLIERGADRLAKSRQKFSPFCLAVFSNAIDAVGVMLSKNDYTAAEKEIVNPNERFPWGVHPFWYACERFLTAPSRVEHDLRMLDVLIEHGASINQADLVHRNASNKKRNAMHKRMNFVTYLFGYADQGTSEKRARLIDKLIRLGIDLDWVYSEEPQHQGYKNKTERSRERGFRGNVFDLMFLALMKDATASLRLFASRLQTADTYYDAKYQASLCSCNDTSNKSDHRITWFSTFRSLKEKNKTLMHDLCNVCCKKLQEDRPMLKCNSLSTDCSLMVCEVCSYFSSSDTKQSLYSLAVVKRDVINLPILRFYSTDLGNKLVDSSVAAISTAAEWSPSLFSDILINAKIGNLAEASKLELAHLEQMGIINSEHSDMLLELFS